ncbi:hypothetical protein KJ940_09845 [Myxococcota bacterium]|nr:hypothetical protein [Myxococcota bacterium]
MRAFFLLWGIAWALVACDDDPAGSVAPSDYEGDEAGECEDGADNDRDGLFDCDDPTCKGSPVCQDGGALPPSSDGGLKPHTDAAPPRIDAATPRTDAATPHTDADPPPIEARYTHYTLTYSLSLDFDDEYAAMLAEAGLGDCANVYEGSGEALADDGEVILFDGLWRMRDSDCAESLRGADMVWTDASGEAFASLTISGGQLIQWVAHRDRANDAPLPEASRHGQFYITEMRAPISQEGAAHHEEVGHTLIEGMLPLTLLHQLDVQLTTP